MRDWRKDLRRVAQGLTGTNLAPKELIVKALPGAVFLVDDKAIQFAKEPGQPHTVHEGGRRCIIVSAHWLNLLGNPSNVLVVPCTASKIGTLRRSEIAIPPGEPGFSKGDVVAMVHLTGPVPKSALIAYVGHVTPETLGRLQAMLIQVLGLGLK